MPCCRQGAAHKGMSAMVTVDLHGDLVCGGGSDGSCTVWSLRTCREKARLTGHQQKVGREKYDMSDLFLVRLVFFTDYLRKAAILVGGGVGEGLRVCQQRESACVRVCACLL